MKIAMLIHASDVRIDSLLSLSRTSYHNDSRLSSYDVGVPFDVDLGALDW